jgi:predicted porin
MATDSVKTMRVRSLFSLSGGVLCLSLLSTPVFAQSSADVAELQRIIAEQQRQLEAQQQQLDAQRQLLEQIQAQTKSLVEDSGKEVDRLERVVKDQQQQLSSLQQQVSEPRKSAPPPSQPMTVKSSAADTKTHFHPPAEKPAEKVVTSGGGERVELAISGHVNRMVNIVDDGGGTETYFVDNDNSESQVRFVGTAQPNEDLILGTTIELSIAPNKSGNVDQLDQETNNIFDQRKAEVTLESKRFGKLWLGKGNTASYTTSAVDLSGTGVIAYSTIVDTAGGLFFREKKTGELTDVRIGNAFSAFDGLNRRNRIRYDSPKFAGFHLQTSAISDQRYDGSLWWAGKGYGFKAAGAAAVGDPNEEDARLQYNGSVSVLHEDTGLNVTLSSGLLERKDQGNQQNFYAKLGWRRDFFSIGETAFGIDYTQSRRLPDHHDQSESYAFAVVQQIEDYGAELFGLYRHHSLDRRDVPKVSDIDVVTIGTRVKF